MILSSLIMPIDATTAHSDHNYTQNNIVETINAEKQLWILINSEGLLHAGVQELYRKIRSRYENIILNDLELAELQGIEHSLWKLHYKHIDEYRNRIRQSSADTESTNSGRTQNATTVQSNYDNLSEGFRIFLSEASEFYQDLITKIRRSYGLPTELLFFKEEYLTSSMESTKMRKYLFSCHRCFVCLGDLARYMELYEKLDTKNCNWSVAASHYLNASMIWPDSGNPQNQLAVLAIYVGDELLALYHCIRSLAIKEPFPDAWDNLILLFEKNRSSHLFSPSNDVSFDFSKPYERTVPTKTRSSDCSSHCKVWEATEGVVGSGETGLWSLVVRMISNFFIKSCLEDIFCTFTSTINELESLLSLDDVKLRATLESYQHLDATRTGPFRALQVVSILIFTICTLSGIPRLHKPKHIMETQQPFLIPVALACTFVFMGRLVDKCLTANPMDCSPLLPAILVFVEWLVDMLDIAEIYEVDEEYASVISYFFGALVDLLNQFDEEGEIKTPNHSALWEDCELRGFAPISHAHAPLDFSIQGEQRNGFEDRHDCQVRISRILLAAMKVVNRTNASRKWIFYEKIGRKFYIPEPKKLPDGRESEAAGAIFDPKVRELQTCPPVSKNVSQLCRTTKESEVPDNEGDQSNLGVHGKSIHVEDEEEILFKPITRYNSVPLNISITDEMSSGGYTKPSAECLHRGSSLLTAQNQGHNGSSGFNLNMVGSSYNKTFWQKELCTEDSITYPFSEPGISSGPPSLSAWVLNRNDFGIEREKQDLGKYGSGCIEDFASACLTSLSINANAGNQPEVSTTTPVSECTGDPNSEGDCAIGPRFVSEATHCSASPYSTTVPSAPLLPSDASWFSGDSTNFAECKDSGGMKEVPTFPGISPVNSYSNWIGNQGPPKFGTGVTGSSGGYTPLPSRMDSTQWLHQYRGNLNFDQSNSHAWPIQFYTPTNLGGFHDHDVSRLATYDQWIQPLASNPMKYLESPPLYPGFSLVYGTDEQIREKLIRGSQKPSPYGYGAAIDPISEQLLLLQYLKEREWGLQRESN